ncbi:hypothetical protein [Streptomyces avicenniae]|uniref:YqeB family protein n=1 Tax=Streptomyces avicenniae TaxID=500153 RepID=UPI00069BBEFC|nr:hypothetical protein [Streptomyces avicenniae]
MPTERQRTATELGLPASGQALLLIGGPALGALLGYFLPRVAKRIAALRWAPMKGPFQLISSWEGHWVAFALGALGLVVGLLFAFAAVESTLRITVTDAGLRLRKDEAVHEIERPDVEAVFLDGKRLVILDRESRHLLRDTSEASAATIEHAFTAHGYPWRAADPYADLYRRWVPETPDLPGLVNALLKAREAALGKKAHDDAVELRGEVEKSGFTVRDEGHRQYWRPLVRS